MSNQKTVLIVEDEKNIVDILRFNLQREGYQTMEAYDGADGLEKARTGNPDLILLDVMLPKMIGFDVCKQLRAEGNNVPVIILTAREEEANKVLGLELGADDYITQPFSVRELMARVGLDVYPGMPLNRLSVAERQLVEIAKALSSNTKVLVMDEPTAALNETEVENLFQIIENVKNSGTSVIYISHRLDEIFRIADRVQVMRDGRSVFVSNIQDTNKTEIVANMVDMLEALGYEKPNIALLSMVEER